MLFELQKQYAEADDFLDPNYEIKTDAWVRFINLPEHDHRHRSTFPTNVDTGDFVQIKGIKTGTEHSTLYIPIKRFIISRYGTTIQSIKVFRTQKRFPLRSL